MLNSVRPGAGEAILRIWAGERDLTSLGANRPPVTRGFIAQVLEQIEGGGGASGGGTVDVVSDDAVARLAGFTGRAASEVKMCLEAAGGDEEVAAAMLLG